MPNRIIKESICTSENIDMLSPFQETVFIRLMVNCDDFGRFDGRAKVISSRLFPLRDITTNDIAEALNAMQKADLIIIYTVDGKPYVQMKTWGKHQQTRATKSKYPSPDESDEKQTSTNDITCNQLISDDVKCSRNRNRYTLNDNRESSSNNDNGFIADADAKRTQHEHDTLLNAAEDAGFKMSNDLRANLINLYSDYGLQRMTEAMASCVEHGAVNLAYLKAVLKGKPRKQTGKTVVAQQYEQRDYAGTAEELISEHQRKMEEWLKGGEAG